jgi:hypothetical protein
LLRRIEIRLHPPSDKKEFIPWEKPSCYSVGTMKTKETPASAAPESDSALTDALVPAFLTEAQAADYLGLTPHQLYLHRHRKGDGPAFVMHGARVRYHVDDLRKWAAALPRFRSIAEALVANPARAEGARRQRATTAIARMARWGKNESHATGEDSSSTNWGRHERVLLTGFAFLGFAGYRRRRVNRLAI